MIKKLRNIIMKL